MSNWIKRIFLPAAALGMLAMPTGVLADGSHMHTDAQVPPIKLGTTGSTQAMLIIDGTEYCFAGTLGGLVEDDAAPDDAAPPALYILSNNHVLAQTNAMDPAAVVPIIQPALFDDPAVCSGDAAPEIVANLSDFVPIVFCEPVGRFMMKCKNNTVDAAIASVVDGAVDADGIILDIGEPAETSASATLGMWTCSSATSIPATTRTISPAS